MASSMNKREHYKMYKKGKAWAFVGIFTATLALGTAGVTAYADSTDESKIPQGTTPSQSAELTNQVSLKVNTATSDSVISDKFKVDKSTSDASDVTNYEPDTLLTKNQKNEIQSENEDVEKSVASDLDNSATKDSSVPTDFQSSIASSKESKSDTVDQKTAKPLGDVNRSDTEKTLVSVSSRHSLLRATPVPTVVTVATQSAADTEESIDQWMPDKNLQQVVLRWISKQNNISSVDQITKQLISEIKTLYADDAYQRANKDFYNTVISIRSLKGLEYAAKLETLDINPNFDASLKWRGRFVYGSVSDISALANLMNLTSINLQMNAISDISSLKNLKLKSVSLSYNQIYDLSPLQESIPTLSAYQPLSSQVIRFPTVYLNANTNTYTLPSFVVTNAQGQNVPIKPEEVSSLFGVASSGTGQNIDSQTVTWKLSAKKGFLFMSWRDNFLGSAGYPFDGEIVVPYELDAAVGNVNVNFKNKEGLSLAPQVTLAGKLGDNFDLNKETNITSMIQKLKQKGYSLVGTEGDVPTTGTYGEAPTNITLLFDVKDINTTFNYVDENGKPLINQKVLSSKYGESWSEIIPDLTGYTFQKATQDDTDLIVTNNQLSGVSLVDTSINLVYVANDETATIHYVYTNGAQAAPDKTVVGKYGDTITFPDSPTITGYTASVLTPAKFEDGNAANTFTVTYTKSGTVLPPVTPDPDQTVTVTVHYQTADGTQVAPDVIITGKAGDTYTTSPAANVPAGYELTTTPANANGTFSDSDITVTYVYAKTGGDGDKVTPEPDKPAKKPNKPNKPTKIPTKKPVTSHLDKTGQGAKVTGNQADLTETIPAAEYPMTLPQTSERATKTTLLGLALLGGLLGLVDIKLKKHE